jgi:hypothetical protein
MGCAVRESNIFSVADSGVQRRCSPWSGKPAAQNPRGMSKASKQLLAHHSLGCSAVEVAVVVEGPTRSESCPTRGVLCMSVKLNKHTTPRKGLSGKFFLAFPQ